jgi:hypothetical protein
MEQRSEKRQRHRCVERQPWDVESESIMTTAGAGRGIAPEQMDRCDARWRARCVYGCIRPVDAGVGEQWSARFVDDSESHRRNHHVPVCLDPTVNRAIHLPPPPLVDPRYASKLTYPRTTSSMYDGHRVTPFRRFEPLTI